MIVKCPSCGTQYHHDAEQLGVLARCSNCKQQVPLEAAKRGYLLMPPEPARPRGAVPPSGMRIGLDDPLLADQLTGTALDGTKPTPLTYKVAGNGAAGVDGALLDADGETRAESEGQYQPRLLRELLVVLLLTSLGVMTAYHWAPQQGMDPTLYMAACGSLGLLFGWICIRWMRPRP